jgi:putative transposase
MNKSSLHPPEASSLPLLLLLQNDNTAHPQKNWPHAPPHAFFEQGTYMITGSTLDKKHFFKNNEDLDYLHNLLITLAEKYGWKLEAWAIFSNHYHFIARSPKDPGNLPRFITHLHSSSSIYLNKTQEQPGRRVWYEYWDKLITYQKSYFARLNYVMQNPVKHKLVTDATLYKWCSAYWFENNTEKSFCKTILNFKTERLNIDDDY